MIFGIECLNYIVPFDACSNPRMVAYYSNDPHLQVPKAVGSKQGSETAELLSLVGETQKSSRGHTQPVCKAGSRVPDGSGGPCPQSRLVILSVPQIGVKTQNSC